MRSAWLAGSLFPANDRADPPQNSKGSTWECGGEVRSNSALRTAPSGMADRGRRLAEYVPSDDAKACVVLHSSVHEPERTIGREVESSKCGHLADRRLDNTEARTRAPS